MIIPRVGFIISCSLLAACVLLPTSSLAAYCHVQEIGGTSITTKDLSHIENTLQVYDHADQGIEVFILHSTHKDTPANVEDNQQYAARLLHAQTSTPDPNKVNVVVLPDEQISANVIGSTIASQLTPGALSALNTTPPIQNWENGNLGADAFASVQTIIDTVQPGYLKQVNPDNSFLNAEFFCTLTSTARNIGSSHHVALHYISLIIILLLGLLLAALGYILFLLPVLSYAYAEIVCMLFLLLWGAGPLGITLLTACYVLLGACGHLVILSPKTQREHLLSFAHDFFYFRDVQKERRLEEIRSLANEGALFEQELIIGQAQRSHLTLQLVSRIGNNLFLTALALVYYWYLSTRFTPLTALQLVPILLIAIVITWVGNPPPNASLLFITENEEANGIPRHYLAAIIAWILLLGCIVAGPYLITEVFLGLRQLLH